MNFLEQKETLKQLAGLAQASGMWSLNVKRAIELAVFHQDRKRLQFLVETFQKKLALDDSCSAALLFPDPEPEEVAFNDISLGSLMTGGHVGTELSEISLNVFVSGPPKKGKSVVITQILLQLISKGIPVHIFDTQDEYPDVLAPLFPPEILKIIDAYECRINPFDGPGSMSQKDWVLGPMCNYLRESLYWRDKTIELFRNTCLEIYESGVERIAPETFIQAYDRIPKYKQNLPEFGSLQRFSTMLKTVPTFQCRRGENIEELAKTSRIYGLGYLPKDARLFIVSHLVTLHAISRQFERDRKLDLVLVFDELSQFFTKETLTRYQDIGESFYLELLRTCRKIGIGVILADQVYSLIHDVVRSNCQSKIILETRDGPSRKEIARDLGLSREQEAFLGEISYGQENRRALVQLSYYPHPFLMKISHFEKPQPLSKKEMQAHKKRAVDSMQWEPISKKSYKKKPECKFLEERELKILKVVAFDHFLSQQEHAKKMEMAVSTFSKYASRLKEAGLINEAVINLLYQGGSIKVLLPTEQGYAYLDKLKVSYPPIQGNGSLAHKFWQHRIWEKVKRKGDLGGIEYSLKEKRVDVGVIRPDEKTAYEIVIDPDLEKEISNLHKDFKEGWGSITFCVESEEMRERLAVLISREISDSDDRVEIKPLKEFGKK